MKAFFAEIIIFCKDGSNSSGHLQSLLHSPPPSYSASFPSYCNKLFEKSALFTLIDLLLEYIALLITSMFFLVMRRLVGGWGGSLF